MSHFIRLYRLTNKVKSQKPSLDNFVQREPKKKQYDLEQLTVKVL